MFVRLNICSFSKSNLERGPSLIGLLLGSRKGQFGLAKGQRILGKMGIKLDLGLVTGNNPSSLTSSFKGLSLSIVSIFLLLDGLAGNLQFLTRSLEGGFSFLSFFFTGLFYWDGEGQDKERRCRRIVTLASAKRKLTSS